MVPEGRLNGNFTKDRKIHGESNVWSTAQEKILEFDVHTGFEWNY